MGRYKRDVIEAQKSAQLLHDARKAASLTQNEVSEALGISQSAISMYEHGQRIPEKDIQEVLCDFYQKKRKG